jgi:hypothetical protein
MRRNETMFKVVFVVGILFFSIFRGGICLADEPTAVLEKLGVLFFGLEEKAGTLVVDSEPQGAAVFVDNVLKGKTPCTLDGIAPGTMTVVVELEGYASKDKELNIQPGETQALQFKLERARADAVTAVALRADPAGPTVKGTQVTFRARGSGGTGKYEYRFFKKGPATGGKWVETQAYSPKSSWTWKTAADDVGSNRITVAVRSLGSSATKAEASKGMAYEVDALPIEALLRELEQKIADADKRRVAHPSFLEELRALVQRYKEDIGSQ